jgi:hypothetical protein
VEECSTDLKNGCELKEREEFAFHSTKEMLSADVSTIRASITPILLEPRIIVI